MFASFRRAGPRSALLGSVSPSAHRAIPFAEAQLAYIPRETSTTAAVADMCAVLRPADSHIVRLANVGALAYPGTASAEAPVFSLLAATVTTAALAGTLASSPLVGMRSALWVSASRSAHRALASAEVRA